MNHFFDIFLLLLEVPFIFRVLVPLAVILVSNKLIKNLPLSMTIGTLLLAFWCGHDLRNVLNISENRLLSANNLFLMVIIYLILIFSIQMKKTAMMEHLVTSVTGLTSAKKSAALMPALIGLLPMPGGAVFSAPLVEKATCNSKVVPVEKTAVNYWFRHIWEYWWPLYPGVILAAEISGIPLFTLMLLMFPLSLFAVGGGAFFLLKNFQNHKSGKKNVKSDQTDDLNNHHFEENSLKKPLRDLFYALSPLIILITVTVMIKFLTTALSGVFSNLPFSENIIKNKYFAIAAGTTVAIAFLAIRNPLSTCDWKNILFQTKHLKLLFLVAVIRIFGAFIESPLPSGIYLMEQIRIELAAVSVPVILTAVLLPFLSGLSTGIAVGFAGAALPVVVNLLGPSPPDNQLYAAVVLAYAAGYMGMILSPVHVCLIVSNEHFKTNLFQSIRTILAPVMTVSAGAVLLYWLYTIIF